MTDLCSEPIFVCLLANSEIKDVHAFFDCREKGLPQQNLTRSVTSHVNREARNLTRVAAAITESILKSDGVAIEFNAHKSQPTRVASKFG